MYVSYTYAYTLYKTVAYIKRIFYKSYTHIGRYAYSKQQYNIILLCIITSLKILLGINLRMEHARSPRMKLVFRNDIIIL